MTDHSPEPWRAVDEAGGNPADYANIVEDAAGIGICKLYYPTKGDYHPDALKRLTANARRIVACVNACSGLSTEYLEQDRLIQDLDWSPKAHPPNLPTLYLSTPPERSPWPQFPTSVEETPVPEIPPPLRKPEIDP